MMKILQSSFFCFFSFTIVFILSLDFWNWNKNTSLLIFSLPDWVFYFIGLQIVLSLVLLIFSVKFWHSSSK